MFHYKTDEQSQPQHPSTSLAKSTIFCTYQEPDGGEGYVDVNRLQAVVAGHVHADSDAGVGDGGEEVRNH